MSLDVDQLSESAGRARAAQKGGPYAMRTRGARLLLADDMSSARQWFHRAAQSREGHQTRRPSCRILRPARPAQDHDRPLVIWPASARQPGLMSAGCLTQAPGPGPPSLTARDSSRRVVHGGAALSIEITKDPGGETPAWWTRRPIPEVATGMGADSLSLAR
jgi:hypothetical protein